MLSIRNIISDVNLQIRSSLPKGSKTHGVAYSMEREGTLRPTEEEQYVGIDNTYPVILYHKINGWNSALRANSGYGDDSYVVNTYSISMIVFNNQKQTRLNPDELALLIQSALPLKILSGNYKSVTLGFTSVILNSQAVWSQEYRSEFKLSENESLFQINYSMEVVFNGCLDLCPEDFLKHKN